MNGLRASARRATATAWLALLALTPLLGGCGPGVGGTGTGDGINTPPPTVTAAPVCGAPFADALACPPGPRGEVAAEGTAPVWFAEAEPLAQVSALFEANAVQLRAPCARLQFSGRWGQSSSLGGRFYGVLTVGGVDRAGSLQVSWAENRLTLVPRDDSDQAVATLPALQRTAGAPGDAGCP